MKILHLEDNLLDAELARQIFLEEWPGCAIEVVDNREDFLKKLPAEPDLILSDFSLVNFTGLEALHLAREKLPHVPFVFFSGTIGEDRALEALRAGASDYVIKDRPKRLIAAMDRALNDAKLQREKRAVEEQMQRVQRLENIGMLAAGIAHDFNNVLAPVLMGIPLLRDRLSSEGDRRLMTSIETSVQRGAGLVKQILGFAQGVTGEPQLIQPKHLIRELVDVIGHTFPKSIKVQDECAPGLWPMKTNPTQFHQVLLNLCVNARDAMPEGGILRVRASNRNLDEAGAAAFPGAKAGPHVLIEVADTGTGIPEAVLARMWEPFFTTKEAGRGTGLGLATVRGIVETHGGAVAVQTKAGYGTTFQVLLPASPAREAELDLAASASIPRGQGELILVVDDDASVREVTGAALTGHGYRVLAASDGTEALALFAPRSLEIRLIVTDLDMPHLDGTALIKIVRSLNPSIRIVTVSGSANVDDPRRQAPPGGIFLAKPYSKEILLGKIHELLGRKSAVPW